MTDVAREVSQTAEYETVQIAARKDGGITAEDDFSDLVLGYVNGDDGAYERSSEILEEHEKTVKKSKPYKSTKALYKFFCEGNAELMVLTPEIRSDLADLDEDYEEKLVILFEKEYKLGDVKTRAVDISREPFTVYLCGTDLQQHPVHRKRGREHSAHGQSADEAGVSADDPPGYFRVYPVPGRQQQTFLQRLVGRRAVIHRKH